LPITVTEVILKDSVIDLLENQFLMKKMLKIKTNFESFHTYDDIVGNGFRKVKK
jgi:hypothetical protein